MTKCSICGNAIQELFLEKLKGTILRKAGSKKQYHICFECQRKWLTKEELLQHLQ